MTDTDSFCRRYMVQWDKRSLVRAKERFELAPDFDKAEMVNPRLVLGATHPKVVALGPDAQRYLMMQHCYEYLEAVACGEAELISKVAIDIGCGEGDGLLSKAARQALMTVATDEIYHAYSARELIEALEAASGIPVQPPTVDSIMVTSAEATFERTSAELLPFVKLMVVGLMENAITDDLVEVIKSGNQSSPFYDFNRIHIMDEACHRAFFRVVLASAWASLGHRQRREIYDLLPFFLKSYLAGLSLEGNVGLRERLCAAGLDKADAETVISDSAAVLAKGGPHPFWYNIRKCLAVTGMLDDPALCARLVEGGWPLEDPPLEQAA